MLKILSNLENITHWLTDWPSYMDPWDNSASKKCIFVFCYSDEIFYCENLHFWKVTSLWNPTNVQGCSVSISLNFSVLDSGWKKMISRFLQRNPNITFWNGAGMVIVVKHRNGRKKERSTFIGFQCRNSRDNASPRLSRWSAQVKWNYIYLPPRPPHSDGRGITTPFIFTRPILPDGPSL